ncbi:MAG TPA: AI-2E family transporter [Polyangia bacterium]|nr:AI-2E family transporter [Polyangia bacterium]
MKRVAVGAAVSLATLMAVVLLWKFAGVAALFVISLAVAATVRPLIESVERQLGRNLALAAVYLSGMTVMAVFLYVALHGILGEVDLAIDRLTGSYAALTARPPAFAGPIRRLLYEQLPKPTALYHVIAASRPAALLDAAFNMTLNLIDLLGGFLMVVALSAYWSASHESFERIWLSLIPAPQRPRARNIWRGIEGAVGAHLRAELAESAIAMLLVAIAFRLGHIPTPMLPALAVGVLRMVPFFGPLLAAAAAALAGWAVDGQVAAVVGLATLALLLGLERGVARHLFHVHRASPTLTVVAAILFVEAFGTPGLLLASTVAIAAEAAIERVIRTHPRRERPNRTLAQIEQRIGHLRRRLLSLSQDEAMQLGNVVARLETLASTARAAASDPR